MAKISIGSWSFTVGAYARQPLSLEEVARTSAELGYDGLALGGFEPHASVERYPTTASRAALMRTLADLGLQVNSYAADLQGFDFASGRKEALAGYFERFRRSLELCADCGIPVIRVDTVTTTPYPASFDYRRSWETAVEVFRRDAEEAQEAGLRVAWEFEPGRLFNKPSEIVAMVREVGMDNFTVQYDTAHGHLCAVMGAHQYGEREVLPGGQEALLASLSGVIGDVHLIDTDGTMRADTNSNKLPFGAGVVEFPSTVRAILAAGYEGQWWTVDLGPQDGEVWRFAAEARAYVAELLRNVAEG